MTLEERLNQLEERVDALEELYPIHPDKIREKAIFEQIQLIEMTRARAKQLIPEGEVRPELQEVIKG